MSAETVLHLIETGGVGGAEQMMVHLAAGLGPKYRSEAALVREGWLGTALRRRGVPVTMLKHKAPSAWTTLRDLATLRDMLRVMRERQVAILHAHEFSMNTLGLVASRLSGVPLVATVHGKNYYPDRLRRRVAYRLVGMHAHQMVTVSKDLRWFLAERIGISRARIRVVPNGVPIDKQPSQEMVSALRTSLGLDQGSRVVGTVGRLSPEKGHRYLIEASQRVARQCPDVVFLVVGRGPLREHLEAQAHRLGTGARLRFLGHREDVRDLLAICDVFVLPSLSEGLPLALLEAMAASVPVVATWVGGVTEVIESEKTGLLVPPADSQAMAESIVTLLEDRTTAKEMGRAARQVIASRFSLTGMVQAYTEIYEGLSRKSELRGVQG